MVLRVNEIFYSIQGESSRVGSPCVFIRLTGCNLRCSWCDTTYAYEEGVDMPLETVVERVAGFGCPLVEVTGGEPLIQKETPDLIRQLLKKGFHVLLETNGSRDVSPVDPRCVKILDIKCPSSGEADRNDLSNLGRLTERDEIKFVIANREDYDFARNILHLVREKTAGKNIVHFSPLAGRMDPKVLAEWMLEEHLPARLQLQIHKMLWPGQERGV